MGVAEAIRSWKDEDFVATLSEEQMALLPENPAGNAGQDLEGVRRDGEFNQLTGYHTAKFCCPETNVVNCTRAPIC
jgi:mersacidin/lichenicidin family type 2 lantibiotic